MDSRNSGNGYPNIPVESKFQVLQESSKKILNRIEYFNNANLKSGSELELIEGRDIEICQS